MKKVALIFCAIAAFSCSSAKQVSVNNRPVNDGNTIENRAIEEGWAGDDTYTVHVTDKNLELAIDRARHQILKDIVNVRMKNNSRYTDITKIQEEFKKPLEKGKVLNPKNTPDGTEIWFRIYDIGLREKFERK